MSAPHDILLSAEDRFACETLVLEFFVRLDAADSDAVAALFAAAGAWHRQGQVLDGPDRIRSVVAARDPERRTCHSVANLRLFATDPDVVEARYYLLAYESKPSAPLVLAAIRDCVDSLASTPEGWRILRKTSRRLLPPE